MYGILIFLVLWGITVQSAECRVQNAECRVKVAFRGAKSILIEKVYANIGVLGVPSSPAAAGASPRRSLED